MRKPREAFRCGCWEFKLRGMRLLVLVGGSYREGWDYVTVKTAMANGGIAYVEMAVNPELTITSAMCIIGEKSHPILCIESMGHSRCPFFWTEPNIIDSPSD